MGNTVKRIVTNLGDPRLVRKIQESFGLKVIEATERNSREEPSNSNSTGNAADGLKNRRSNTKKQERKNGVILSMAVDAIKKKTTKRQHTAAYVVDSLPSSPEGSTPPPPELSDVDVETYPLLDYYFKFVSQCGYEPFFITILPLMYWNVDTLVARHLTVLWGVSIYLGNAAKRAVKWQRPDSPPVIRIEVSPRLEQEYGFPSTHALVATVIPFFFVYICYWRYQDLFYQMLVFSIVWWVSVCISRVYLGVHSVLDVIGGTVIAVLVLVIITPFLDLLDHIIFSYSYFAPLSVLVCVLMVLAYPSSDHWSIDRGDVCAVLGATIGVLMGCSYNGPYPEDHLTGPIPIRFPSTQELGFCMLRFIVGVLLIFPVRFIMKLLCFRLLPSIMPDHGIQEVQKRPLVEIPYKLITYSAIGFTMSCVCMVVFELCNISRL